ncbi:sulfotransferase [Aurantibacter sp.]|uniref:sulfotransferase family protein n=1 Tax=Aurantibacter sp. TaxID=2807103 RepID=UPI0035C83A9C
MEVDNLIFIASQPRSGSTYLQNILSNNKQTNTVSESWLMLVLAPLFKPEAIINSTYDHKLATQAFVHYQKKVNLDFDLEVRELALKLYKPLFSDFKFVIDKTPRYWEILDNLVTLFPESKIIILKRNPLDVVKSMIETWDIISLEKLNYFRNDILNAPLVIDEFLERHRGNPNIIDIYYTDLVDNKTKTIKTLYENLGITFNDLVFDTSKNIKYKGEFGDPYQNNVLKKNKKLNLKFDKFLSGYVNYLGEDYFKKHNYKFDKGNKSKAFNYFISLGDFKKTVNKSSLKKELSLFIKKRINKL